MLRKNYDAAQKIYLAAKEVPNSPAAANWAALARAAIYQNKNALAAQFLERSRQRCKEEFPDRPCETIVFLQTILAARQQDHEAARKQVSSLRNTREIYSGFTVHFQDSDRQLCAGTLKSAGYDDLIKILGPYALPANNPRRPLAATTIKSVLAK